jgi:hypothetical protein
MSSAADCDESFGAHLARRKLVDITPHPAFPRFDGANQRMLALVEMFRGMLVLGRITAPHISALQAKAKMHPRVALFDAFFANVLVGAIQLYLVEMFACSGH